MPKEDSFIDLFLRLVKIQAPSGFEEEMIKAFLREVSPYVDETKVTPRGNVIATKKGTNPNALKIALVAHLDQIGFIVSNIEPNGFLRFEKIGGPVNRAIQGHRLQILTDNGPVFGVVGVKPGHITTKSEENTIPSIEEMYIDVGANTVEDAKQLGVDVGVPITYSTTPLILPNGLIASQSVDNRAGVAAIIGVAKALSMNHCKSTIYYIGSVEEEIGLRGAETALHKLDVDLAIAVDTFPAGYQPDVNMRDLVYEVGKGPAIHVGEMGDRLRIGSQQVYRWLKRSAAEADIPHQIGIMHGGTDAMSLMQTGEGIPSATIGIPRRYSHSPVEVFDPKDAEKLIGIILVAVNGLDSNFKISRI